MHAIMEIDNMILYGWLQRKEIFTPFIMITRALTIDLIVENRFIIGMNPRFGM
jgi:hypothetical protein